MQLQLPMIPEGATTIRGSLSVLYQNEKWCYNMGISSIFEHEKTDLESFRFITSSLISTGACKNADIVRIFGVSKSSVIRAKNNLEKFGPSAFFKKKRKKGQEI